ncbi:Alpha/Beta hydrolase protein [Aspergillus spinulosporus]
MNPASITESLNPINTHDLFCSITGPTPHDSSDPLVVIIPGAGDVASSYVAVERLLRPFIRTLLYDRSGLGRSKKYSPKSPSLGAKPPIHGQGQAVTAATELGAVLENAGINPDTLLLLLAHSYGAIVAREFLHLYPERVAGMVLVDASTERASKYFNIPDQNIDAVMGNMSYARATGLRSQTVLSDEEWRVRAREIIASSETAAVEAASFYEVCETLKRKDQLKSQALGNRPLSVIRANTASEYMAVYEKGVAAGNGTEEQRAAFRSLLDKWECIDKELQEEQLQLSSNTHFVRLEECGHNVHLVRPDVIAQEVRWVRDRVIHFPRVLVNSLLRLATLEGMLASRTMAYKTM